MAQRMARFGCIVRCGCLSALGVLWFVSVLCLWVVLPDVYRRDSERIAALPWSGKALARLGNVGEATWRSLLLPFQLVGWVPEQLSMDQQRDVSARETRRLMEPLDLSEDGL